MAAKVATDLRAVGAAKKIFRRTRGGIRSFWRFRPPVGVPIGIADPPPGGRRLPFAGTCRRTATTKIFRAFTISCLIWAIWVGKKGRNWYNRLVRKLKNCHSGESRNPDERLSRRFPGFRLPPELHQNNSFRTSLLPLQSENLYILRLTTKVIFLRTLHILCVPCG